MQPSSRSNNQQGFSLLEMIVVVTLLVIMTAAVSSLMKSSVSISNATYELTDAQEGLRTAQEFINRDLVSAGDGLRSMTYIPVQTAFVTNYLSLTPVPDPAMPAGVTNLGILTTDNDVPANTVVFGLDPKRCDQSASKSPINPEPYRSTNDSGDRFQLRADLAGSVCN